MYKNVYPEIKETSAPIVVKKKKKEKNNFISIGSFIICLNIFSHLKGEMSNFKCYFLSFVLADNSHDGGQYCFKSLSLLNSNV